MANKPKIPIDENAYSPVYRNSITITGLSGIKFKTIVKLQSEYGINLAKFIKICINAFLNDNRLMMDFLNSWQDEKQISSEIKQENKKKQAEIERLKKKFQVSKEDCDGLFDRFLTNYEEEDEL